MTHSAAKVFEEKHRNPMQITDNLLRVRSQAEPGEDRGEAVFSTLVSQWRV